MIAKMRLRSNNGWSSDSPQTFNSGGYGFVMVSFGSYVETVLSNEKITMVATAFGKLKQRVLWRVSEGNSWVSRDVTSFVSVRHVGVPRVSNLC